MLVGTLVLLALLDQFSQYNLPLGLVPMQITVYSYPSLLCCTSYRQEKTFLIFN